MGEAELCFPVEKGQNLSSVLKFQLTSVKIVERVKFRCNIEGNT